MTDRSDRPLCECHGEPMRRNRKWWRCAVKSTAYNRVYYAENREKLAAYKKAYYAARREEILDRQRETSARNNPRRLRVNGMYFGMVGFTQREREAILSGAAK